MNQNKMTIAFGTTVWKAGGVKEHFDGIGMYTMQLYHALKAQLDVNWSLEPAWFGKSESGMNAGWCLDRSFEWHVLKSQFLQTRIHYPTAGVRPVLFHATDHRIPALSGVPVVATVMDVIPFIHPEWVSGRQRQLKNWLFRRTILSADYLLTISEHSKHDLMQTFALPSDRIFVTPLGVNTTYFEKIDKREQQTILNKLGLMPGFFLFIGTLQPRKNLERLLIAHATLSEADQKAHPIVLVGKVGWKVDHLLKTIQNRMVSGTVKWLNYLPERDVHVLLQSAQALLFPSLYEGFGLPILEAFASHCPVIASNTTAIPEVAGEAAYLVDPMDCHAMTVAMQTMITSPAIRRSLQTKGCKRVEQFSWSQCAKKTLSVYEKIISDHPA